mmetsp:Transcript_11842/g.23315  ORF Transcript_11842/g.23315 Transcript_11842/m.23315 type:complete len:429 (-) Transcript_11842:213-1499(-)
MSATKDSAGSSKKRKAITADEAIAESANEKHQYFCDFCRKDISGVVRIRCAECKDFDLCLECFSVGVEVAPHVNSHGYRVMYHVTTPIFDAGWGADEELLLLEAIEQCGFGNWGDIADHIGTKSKEECERHYEDIYLSSGANPPVPDLERPLRPKAPLAEPIAGTQENYKSGKTEWRTGSASALLNYFPKRRDFDHEWENDAETRIADMEFSPKDTPTERTLKLQMIRWYNTILDGRLERKQFIFERSLLTREKKRGKDERDVLGQLQMFARYMPQDDWEKFANGMLVEYALRKEIAKFQYYIKNGLRTQQDVAAFEYERKRRQSVFSFSTKRRQTEEPDGSELLQQKEKEKIKELDLPVTVYLRAKHAMVVQDLQNSKPCELDGSRAKKKSKKAPRPDPPAILNLIASEKLKQLKAFFRSNGWIEGR